LSHTIHGSMHIGYIAFMNTSMLMRSQYQQ